MKIEDMLNSLPKEELIDIILDITKSNKNIKSNIIFRYSKGNYAKELEICKRRIDSIVDKYENKVDCMDYNVAYRFTKDMGILLKKISSTDNIILSLDIAFLVLDAAMESFEYLDDSDGYIFDLITETIDLIDHVIKNSKGFDINTREEVFNKLLEEYDNNRFNGWEEFEIDILRICTYFADIKDLRNKLIEKIEFILSEKSNDNYIEDIMNKIVLNIKEEHGI